MEITDDKRIDLLLAPVHDLASFCRLVLGLSTGALVLFINLAYRVQVRLWITILLLLAILCFGAAAGMCLWLLMRIVEVHAAVGEWARGSTSERVQLEHLLGRCERTGNTLSLTLIVGMFLSAVFIIALSVARARP